MNVSTRHPRQNFLKKKMWYTKKSCELQLLLNTKSCIKSPQPKGLYKQIGQNANQSRESLVFLKFETVVDKGS